MAKGTARANEVPRKQMNLYKVMTDETAVIVSAEYFEEDEGKLFFYEDADVLVACFDEWVFVLKVRE